MTDRAAVRNAADPVQVRRAGKKDQDKGELFRAALVAVMGTVPGRAFVWGLLERAGVYQSIWSPNAEIHYRAGRQDYGHELMADVLAADEELFLQMEREARGRVKKDNAEIDAAATPASDQEQTSNG